ncbi:P-loop NTPase [Chloroflexota bacterium]
MLTEEQVKERLEEVLVPGAMKSITKLNLVRRLAVCDGKVEVDLASAALNEAVQKWLKAKVRDAVKELPGLRMIETSFVDAKPAELNEVGGVIAVMSGKGGVGKSLVTSLAAVSLARRGQEVGILDADITGPSIPKMFDISGRPLGSESGIMPVTTHSGIEVMSINLLLENADDAVIWRGPVIANTIKQFWEDVLWGKLDYLLVDLPPGTSDAPLTVMQSLPLAGVVIVFSPQELSTMAVKKAVQMVRKMEIPILGMVENMSYLLIPETSKRLEIFGRSRAEEMAEAAGAPLLGQIPIDPELARLSDEGDIERYGSDSMKSFSEAFFKAVEIGTIPSAETRA